MKFRNVLEGNRVLVHMPKGCGSPSEQEVVVVYKSTNGVVLLEKPDGKRFWANAGRLAPHKG